MNNNLNKTQLANTIKHSQQLASNPNYSIWVNAHAGTGKTKVLVDRILRILLQKIPHSQMLCITYTNAAAAEINTRIMNILSKWSYIEEEQLTQHLQEIGIQEITPNLIITARALCSQILDSNFPIKIQTIHSFCQKILENFFLEASLNNSFSILKENTPEFLNLKKQLFNNVLLHLTESQDIDFNTILLHENENTLESFINEVISNSIELAKVQNQYSNLEQLKEAIFDFFKLNSNINYNDYKMSLCSNESFEYKDFLVLTEQLNSTPSCLTKTDITTLNSIENWLKLNPQERANNFKTWLSIFFTINNTPKKKVFNKAAITAFPFIESIINIESNRLYKSLEQLNNIQLAYSNFELFKLAFFINDQYNQQKQLQNAVDYNDLIYKVFTLLNKQHFLPWIFYKLNQQISHILIDEAQDTSPIQWEIIKIIIKEIFSNTEESKKSIFIVGDLKQSIYSFQGAYPKIIPNIKEAIKNLVITYGYKWNEVNLNTSFRSSNAVLTLVNYASNHLFKQNNEIQECLVHNCFKTEFQGRVEIWPLIISNEENKYEYLYSLAKAIANKIIHLINIEKIPPRDIMVLYKKRSNNITLHNIIKIIKQHNIPTSGVDKISLVNHIAIMDIISIAKFALQPLDNFNLATLLKTPIFQLSDENLIKLIKENSHHYLWHILQNQDDKNIQQITTTLLEWQKIANNTSSLFELFSTLFYKKKLQEIYLKFFGPDILDLFSHFINIIINFEKTTSTPTLEHFIFFLENSNPSINKEIGSESNEVRFLTIHGSKGLESKIVFLIDNNNFNNTPKIIKTTTAPLPVLFKLSKNKGYSSQLYQEIIDTKELEQMEENKRLLYVALTRAKEKLYICTSCEINKELKNTSFYNYIINCLPDTIVPQKEDFFTPELGFINNLVTILK